MRKGSFWEQAANSLPVPVRRRYAGYFESAERFDELVDTLVALTSRAKKAVGGLFHTVPRAPRTHP